MNFNLSQTLVNSTCNISVAILSGMFETKFKKMCLLASPNSLLCSGVETSGPMGGFL